MSQSKSKKSVNRSGVAAEDTVMSADPRKTSKRKDSTFTTS